MANLSASASGRRPLDVPALSTGTQTGALAVAAAAALASACLLSPATATHGPVVCPFRLLTGLPCPGCGMTRAWVFLAHGRFGDAAAANPFAFVTLPAAVALVVVVALSLVRRRPLPDLGRVVRSRATWWVLGAWIAFAAVRALAVLTGHASL